MHAPDVTRSLAFGPGQQTWRVPAPSEIIGWALPHLGFGDRLLLRALALLARCHILSIHALQHIRPAGDPFILAVNHGTRRESLLVPALLLLQKGWPAGSLPGGLEFPADPGRGFDLQPCPGRDGAGEVGEAAGSEYPKATL